MIKLQRVRHERSSYRSYDGIGLTLCTILLALFSIGPAGAEDVPKVIHPPRLLIAVASLRDRERHPQIDLYEHDGASMGKLLPGVSPVDKRSDHHPQLTQDGKQCVFCFEIEGQPGRIGAWDLEKQVSVDLPDIHAGDQAHMAPTIDATGRLIVFEGWRRPGSPGRWDLMQYDRSVRQATDIPGLCSGAVDERKPALSADGRRLALTHNPPQEAGGTDITLWTLGGFNTFAPRALNTTSMETEPALSGDGRLLAFVSDRPGGDGARDIYLFDLAEEKYLPLPGLNTPGHEQSPCLSADGRFLAFVSERLDGAGERDVYLYDRERAALLPTPGLNSFRDEYDPYVITLP